MEQDSYYSFERLIVNVQERITIMQRKPTLLQSGDRPLADPGPGGNALGGNMQFAMAGGGTLDAAMAITAENAMVIAALNSMYPDIQQVVQHLMI